MRLYYVQPGAAPVKLIISVLLTGGVFLLLIALPAGLIQSLIGRGNTPGYGGNAAAAGTDDGNGFGHTPQGFPRFAQGKGPWRNQVYGTACSGRPTVALSACGPSSLAAVVTYYLEKGEIQLTEEYKGLFGNDVNPGTVATLSEKHGFRACGAGTKGAMFDYVGRRYFGLQADRASIGWSAALDVLRQGYPVIVGGHGGIYPDGGHLLVFFGIDDVNRLIYISDSSSRNKTQATFEQARGSVYFGIKPITAE